MNGPGSSYRQGVREGLGLASAELKKLAGEAKEMLGQEDLTEEKELGFAGALASLVYALARIEDMEAGYAD